VYEYTDLIQCFYFLLKNFDGWLQLKVKKRSNIFISMPELLNRFGFFNEKLCFP